MGYLNDCFVSDRIWVQSFSTIDLTLNLFLSGLASFSIVDERAYIGHGSIAYFTDLFVFSLELRAEGQWDSIFPVCHFHSFKFGLFVSSCLDRNGEDLHPRNRHSRRLRYGIVVPLFRIYTAVRGLRLLHDLCIRSGISHHPYLAQLLFVNIRFVSRARQLTSDFVGSVLWSSSRSVLPSNQPDHRTYSSAVSQFRTR